MGYVTNLVLSTLLVLTPISIIPQQPPEVLTTGTTAPYSTIDEAITSLAKKYKQDEKLARKIISCEGQAYKQIGNNKNIDKDGKVWSVDVGLWQINNYYHEANAIKMGLDIYDDYGNLEYGFILLSTQGVKPWKASQRCWSS